MPVDSLPAPLPAHIASLISAGVSNFFPPEETLEAFNAAFLQRHSPNAARTLAAARGLCIIQGNDTARQPAEELVLQLTREEMQADIPVCAVSWCNMGVQP